MKVTLIVQDKDVEDKEKFSRKLHFQFAQPTKGKHLKLKARQAKKRYMMNAKSVLNIRNPHLHQRLVLLTRQNVMRQLQWI